MCRLLGIVSARRAPLPELLGRDLADFRAMACTHSDGWGLGYSGPTGKMTLVKEPVRADLSTAFQPAVESCETEAAILHIRLASPNMAVAAGNTHPFGDDRAAFAHNGGFWPRDVLDDLIGPDRLAALEGDTDSERYHETVRRRMDDGVDPAKALIQTAQDIHARAEGSVSLNSLLLTADALYAYADHDPSSEVLERRGPDFFDLCYRVDRDRVVVGSTGLVQPAPEWARLGQRRVLRVDRHDLSTTIIEA